jgi:hypothetical protein
MESYVFPFVANKEPGLKPNFGGVSKTDQNLELEQFKKDSDPLL